MPIARPKALHVNPVYRSYFADPFVWRVGDGYFAIGTGALEASGQTVGRIFPVLRSEDFFHWKFASNAMVRPDPALGTHFWAPEIAARDDRFYLYYSVGHADKNHQLRVASGEDPEGPYEDCGHALLNTSDCPFAIDPHPFQDDDGQWYLFYARDFLDVTANARAGTAVMVARMKSPTGLENPGKVVVRARHDWQRFQLNRPMYDRVWDWHTIEGPFLQKHDGRYYCFYSGGRWESDNYGVDYCVADNVMGPYSDESTATGPRVLHTVPNQLIGPGHNSIVTGPDDETEFIVYHAWDKEMKARQMFIDRLIWTSSGPRCESEFGRQKSEV